jgi:hypothetical protein
MNNSLVRSLMFAALTSLGGTTLMQASTQASFHLSAATHWGNAVLPPGDYKMSLPDDSIGQHQVKIEGAGKTVYIFPIVTDITDKSSSSHLDLKEIDGEYFVRGFSSGVLGKEFTFHTPKTTHHQYPATGM